MKPTASQTVIHESLSQLREALRGCGQTTQPGMRLPSFSITQVCDALIKCYTSKDDPYWVRNLSDCITGFLEMATHANDQFVILAGSAPEAEIWARAMHLQPKQCIYASSPMRVTGISNAKVVTLPGFVNHRDRWAILDMVNSARGTGTVTDYVEELENSTMSDGKKPISLTIGGIPVEVTDIDIVTSCEPKSEPYEMIDWSNITFTVDFTLQTKAWVPMMTTLTDTQGNN